MSASSLTFSQKVKHGNQRTYASYSDATSHMQSRSVSSINFQIPASLSSTQVTIIDQKMTACDTSDALLLIGMGGNEASRRAFLSLLPPLLQVRYDDDKEEDQGTGLTLPRRLLYLVITPFLIARAKTSAIMRASDDSAVAFL